MIQDIEAGDMMKQEAQIEAAMTMQQAEAVWQEMNAVVGALRKQMVAYVAIMRDRFLPSLENLGAGIAEGETIIKDDQDMLKIVEEGLGASAASYALSDTSDLFEGEVVIAILPPVDMAQLIRLRRNLLGTSYLKILRTAGACNEGTLITVVADEPLPLTSMLVKMPEVEKAELRVGEEEADGDFPWDLAFEPESGNRQRKMVLVTLKKE
jgi:hypothetical protein